MHGTAVGQSRDDTAARFRRLAAKANAEACAAEEHHHKSEQYHRKSVAHAIRCGEALLKAQAILLQAQGYGNWGTWLRDNFQYSGRLARLYMQVAASPPEVRQRVAELPLRKAFALGPPPQSVEIYTPAPIIEAARRALGGAIDLDPASDPEANAVVGATVFYGKEDNSLSRRWRAARVWMNRPYCGHGGAFVTKLLSEYRSGNVGAAIVLVNGFYWETEWFKPLFDHTLCSSGEVQFWGPGVRQGHPRVASVLAYLGPDAASFEREFDPQFGW